MHELIKAMKALSDETRLRAVNLLMKQECCVCEVVQALDILQTRASRNLTILYEAGFLKLRKDGLWSHYSIDRRSLEDWRLALLEAAAEGLKGNQIARHDLVRLAKSRKLSKSC
jgi:ArsR family transcriptional regulator, arsenate/arsenite/antimonite-responsive transcriptional repressor